eukprot:CAMPEP_0174346338 /NCGR_PEP_ID=MMETSP0811_2-20130205/2023_1 /TAXON_ID=73025 ORGANISM="Eutreptiella gymnastica-like, Strain CCMP1594" /NCGR_SAMPLE_ID=MMETSP0811_2 /ASSEMBLY_ACC=CAM_ASM_000667 /LENGTH=40 /DNA_ID= /DNA_START= /DNA_END= /DNA_ORIENTATION=
MTTIPLRQPAPPQQPAPPRQPAPILARSPSGFLGLWFLPL